MSIFDRPASWYVMNNKNKGVEKVDRFFTQKNCDRCGSSLEDGRIMSMFSEECICLDCKEKEKEDKDYKKASDLENEQVKSGNYNYKGMRG